jgi:hypothetical protein
MKSVPRRRLRLLGIVKAFISASDVEQRNAIRRQYDNPLTAPFTPNWS